MLIAITGGSGAGKTTLVNYILVKRPDYKLGQGDVAHDPNDHVIYDGPLQEDVDKVRKLGGLVIVVKRPSVHCTAEGEHTFINEGSFKDLTVFAENMKELLPL